MRIYKILRNCLYFIIVFSSCTSSAQDESYHQAVIAYLDSVDAEKDLQFLLGSYFDPELASSYSDKDSSLKFRVGKYPYLLKCLIGEGGCNSQCRKMLSFHEDPLLSVESYMPPLEPELILLLSEVKGNYLECIIRFNTHHESDYPWLLSYGSVVVYQFCFTEGELEMLGREEWHLN